MRRIEHKATICPTTSLADNRTLPSKVVGGEQQRQKKKKHQRNDEKKKSR
jgi:hypothetical protein